MHVQAFVFCKSVDEEGGIISLNKLFERDGVAEYPLVITDTVAALRIIFRRAEIGMRDFELRIIDPDGESVIDPILFPNELGLHDGYETGAKIIKWEFEQLLFARPGVYWFEAALDGRVLGRFQFEADLLVPEFRSEG